MDINKTVIELNRYAEIEGSEIGDCCILLSALETHKDELSNKFYEALCKEIEYQLKLFKECCVIVKEDKVYNYTEERLEWHEAVVY